MSKAILESTVFCMTILAVILSVQPNVLAGTLNVDGQDTSCSDSTGTPYCTIQAAINAAATSDVVLVMPGTYVENIDFNGKAITVRSDQGADYTIINGNNAGSVAVFSNGETSSSVLDGFTLEWGFTDREGGGVYISSSSPTIKNNIITNNTAGLPGLGIHISGGNPIIDGNTISNNQSSGSYSGGGGGGGIAIYGGDSAQITNNIIVDNSVLPHFGGAGGIYMNGGGRAIIRNNFIARNAGEVGGGIGMVNGADPLIVQNIIAENYAKSKGGGIYWSIPATDGPQLVNNTIVNNDCASGSGVYAGGFDTTVELINNLIVAKSGQTAVYCDDGYDGAPPVFASNDIYSPSGGLAYDGICGSLTGVNGNISVATSFVDSSRDDYRLPEGSAVVDMGDGTSAYIPATDYAGNTRINGAAIDIGAYEYVPIPGYFELSFDKFSVDEDGQSVTIAVVRKAGRLGSVSVDVSTSDGTAKAGADYSSGMTTLTFDDGDMSEKQFTLSIIDDNIAENMMESFKVTLSNPTGGATIGTVATASVFIIDNETSTVARPSNEKPSGGCFITSLAW